MEDIFGSIMEDVKKAEDSINKNYIPLAQAIVKYADKKDIDEPVLYLILRRMMKDMEEVDPLLKGAREFAEECGRLDEDCSHEKRSKEISDRIGKLAEDIIDEL